MQASSRRRFVPMLSCAALALTAVATGQDPAGDRLTLQGEFLPGQITVEKTGSVYALRFRGANSGVEYQIDVNHVDVRKGMMRVYEKYSDCFPLVEGGASFLALNGAQYVPSNLGQYTTLTADYISGNSVVLEYTDNVPSNGVHHRRHRFTIKGHVLSITLEDVDQNLNSKGNYNGFWMGPTSGTEDVRKLPMQGALAQPLFMFQNGAEHWFCGAMLDLAQSNAADWTVKDINTLPQGGNSIDYTMPTTIRYYPNSAGKISAPVKDTWNIAISQKIEDVLLAPTQKPSPYRELMVPRTVVMLASNATSWQDWKTHLQQFSSWGMDDIAAYSFFYWSTSAFDPPAPQTLGPDWYPAKDPGNFTSLASSARSLGIPLGVYVAFSTLPPSAPAWVYDPTHIARKDTGAYKTNSQNGLPLIAITASGIHARRETLLLKQNYDLTAAYLDIQSYGSPSHGVDGDHIDQLATSPWAKSMRQGILDQKLWMRDMTDTLEGPMMGEGSIATQHSNLEWLWGGYCDSVQRVINTGSLTVASNQPLGDPDSPTLWPVIPEFELRVMKPLQVNHGNGFYERFFSRSDTGMTTSNGQPILPATTAMLDRYRVYEITYGHSAFFATSGPWDVPNNRLSFANMIKEYYMMHSLQSRYFSSNVKSIKYLYNNQLLNFARVIAQTETVDTFRDARIRIEYHNGLEVYVNHGVGSWSLSVGNVAYVIPQDGFVAYQPSTNFVAFSAVPPGTGGQRIDYCFAPGEYEFFDGRGTVAGYGNINTGTVKKLKLTNFINGKTVQQNSSGSIQVTQGVVPAVTSVELIPGANPIAVGDRVSVKALAHFNNGAFRAVTSLVNWSSTNPTVASVNEGGAIFAHLPGTTTITATNYQGVTAPALVVTVN